MAKNIKKHIYYVKGMHCASCEILIEKKLLKFKNIKSVESSTAKGEVLIEYKNERPAFKRLNNFFKKEGYIFSDQPRETMSDFKSNELFITLGIGLFIIFSFIGLNKLGLSGLINVNAKSSLPMFFLLGLIAGISSCAALVSGIILSMSKQWLEIYSNQSSILKKLQPHLMFNAGRIVSYTVLGTILGLIGSKLQISLGFTSFLTIAVSILMFFLALQMLGVKSFQNFQFTLPKFATRYITDETNFKGRYMPFVMGALTFFLPCGFTITTQGLALISGNAIQGGLIMLFFALGTLPMLLIIGLSSVKLSEKPHLTNRFLKVAGVLVLFFALFNINSQLNVLGYSSFNDFFPYKKTLIETYLKKSNNDLAPIVRGKQILKMNASSSGYSPNYFKVRVGIPVRWEITDKGTSGCTNAIISKNLFDGEIPLTPGQTSIKEFTPTNSGKYKFSCWMGMVSGIIEVVDEKSATKNPATTVQAAINGNDNIISSDIRCCGCGERYEPKN